MIRNSLGWNTRIEQLWQRHPDFAREQIARVLSSNRNHAQVQTETGEISATIPPLGSQLTEYPVPGDWCVVKGKNPLETSTRILDILSRRACIRRKRVGAASEPQTLAANVDTALVLTARSDDFKWNRLDRYLTMILSEGVQAIICLTKSDLDPDPEKTESIVQAAFPNVPTLTLSVRENSGMDRLRPYLVTGQTSTLLGSSGVGKSTLTNWLLGYERRATQQLRVGGTKGRHTTSNGRMFQTLDMGWIIDLPGIREIEPWNAQTGLEENFSDISRLAQQCRYRNCRHRHEDGCAVLQAVENGILSERTLNNYERLQREQEHQERQEDRRSAAKQKRREKSISKLLRKRIRAKQN